MRKIIMYILILVMLGGVAAAADESDDINTPGDSIVEVDKSDEEEGNAEESEEENKEPDDENKNDEKYAEIIIDELENFDMISDKSNGIISEDVSDDEPFYGDPSIVQRADKSEHYIEYDLPYWEKAEVTAYFYAGEEINHFVFKTDEIEIEPKITVTKENGKWNKVEYEIHNPKCTQRKFRIIWQDVSDTDFTNWGQALGMVKVYKAFPKASVIEYQSEYVFPIPDSESVKYNLEASVYDQAGKVFDTELVWKCEGLSDGISFDEENAVLEIFEGAEDKSEIEVEISAGDAEPLHIILSFKTYKPGDINGDFKIDEQDLEIALENYCKSDNTRGDINNNKITDIYDLAYIKKNFGITD